MLGDLFGEAEKIILAREEKFVVMLYYFFFLSTFVAKSDII